MKLLERESHLSRLTEILAGLKSGGGRIVLVRGEAGIGKTSLVRAFLDQHRDEAEVLLGTCDDLLTAQPLGPLWDMALDESELAKALRANDRRLVFDTFLGLLSRHLRPTVAVIEDIHWADGATLDAIRFIGRRIGRTHSLVILTYRDRELMEDNPHRRVLGDISTSAVDRIILAPLSRQAVVDLVGDSPLDTGEVWEMSGGNPYFVEEMIRAQSAEPLFSIEDAVLAQVARLSPSAQLVARRLAVIPGDVESWLADELLGTDKVGMIECERRGLIHVTPHRVSFRHELSRRTIEASLGQAERIELNHHVLALLVGRTNAARIVHHAREAGAIDEVVRHAPIAARQAATLQSHREAAAYYRVLDHYLDRLSPDEAAEILSAWAHEEFLLANTQTALTLVERAAAMQRTYGAHLPLARTMLLSSRIHWFRGDGDGAERSAAEAVRMLEDLDARPLLSLALSAQSQIAMNRHETARSIALADRAMDLAEPGDQATIAHALINKGTSVAIHRYAEGLPILEEGMRIAENAGVAEEHQRAAYNAAWLALECRDLTNADRLLTAAEALAKRYELTGYQLHTRASRAWLMLLRGNWDAAQKGAERVLASDPGEATRVIADSVRCVLGVRRGVMGVADLDLIWDRAVGSRELQRTHPAAMAQAEYLWLADRADDERLERVHHVLEETRRLGLPWWTGSLALWLWQLGLWKGSHRECAQPYRLLMDGDARSSAAAWAEIGCPYERAMALLHGEADDQTEATRILDQLGATAVAAKARLQLRRSGINIPRGKGEATRKHPLGLTRRQAEVIEGLVEGLSNLEIADRLFVSPRTIEHHVSAILTKLGVANRDEAVRLMSMPGSH